jgi:hypothetical protein
MPDADPPVPFFLIVADHGLGIFSVEGPMTDGRPWEMAARRAREGGRQVACGPRGPDRDALAAECRRSQPRRRTAGKHREAPPMSGTASQPEWLWTWSGESFGYREANELWTHDGRHVGHFDGEQIFHPEGCYLGELMDGTRLITAKFGRGAHRARFAAQPPRARSPRRTRLPGYIIPTGFEDFPLPEKLP